MKKKQAVLIVAVALALVMGSACKKTPSSPDDGTSGLEFSGAITSGGMPMAGVDVYLTWGASRKTVTGSDGKFSFTGLASGNYRVTPAKLNYAFNPSYGDLSSTRKDLNFTASAANYGTTEGTIGKNFTAKDQHGENVSLNNYHGKVVLIDFTADWCGPCREKAPTANAFFKQYEAQGFMYILIVIKGSPATWAAEYGLTFPVLDDDPHDPDPYKGGPIYREWRTSGSIPLPHVLDRNLKILYKKEGWTKDEVENLIKKCL